MKKLITILCITAALGFVAQADDTKETKKKHEASAEYKALVDKYDTNKDGKLDKEERAKISAEDKAKMKELAPAHKKKDTEKK